MTDPYGPDEVGEDRAELYQAALELKAELEAVNGSESGFAPEVAEDLSRRFVDIERRALAAMTKERPQVQGGERRAQGVRERLTRCLRREDLRLLLWRGPPHVCGRPC